MAKNIPDKKTYAEISEWLNSYHSAHSEHKKAKLKALIVTQMIPVVKHIARTIARRAADPIEDMVQAGFIGLLKAIDNYSKEKNDNFRVYAGYFIIGEMKHYLRDKLNMIRVPRHIQELSIRINNFTQNLTPEEVSNLTSDEVASALDVTPQTIDFALEVDRRRSTLSLEDVFKTDSDSLNYEEFIADKNYLEQSDYEDARIIFEDVIDKLPPEEKVIIDMYYKQDMNKKEIADALLLTQMSVNRKMKNAFNIIAALVAENTRKKELKEEVQKKNMDKDSNSIEKDD